MVVGLPQAKRLRVQARGKGGGSYDPNFFLHISSSWVKLRLPSENHLPGLPGWSTTSKEAESPSREGGGRGEPDFFLHISSSLVKLRLPSENHLPG